MAGAVEDARGSAGECPAQPSRPEDQLQNPDERTLARLRRFPLQLPLRYRYPGGFQWFNGVSQNISCSGVLFRGRVKMDPLSPVEVRVPLPRQMTGDAAATMLCGGYIVRVVEEKEPRMAAAFVEYRLQYQNGQRKVQFPPLELGPTLDEVTTEFFHELRNLLAIVMGNGDLILSSRELQPEVRQCAVRIMEASERAAVLLRRINGTRRA